MPRASSKTAASDARRLAILRELERKVLWLSTWTIHQANHLRPSRDGLKVGGHQASSASVCTLLTALYLDVLRPQDRVAVKPHASPVYHAIQYLLGRQTRENLEQFRSLGGAQSYPSRTKDVVGVDFSTGSVGLGVAMTLFASLVQDYVRAVEPEAAAAPPGRMVAVLGDAELDEGNVFEAMLEGWKHDVRNLWWVVDYNRQSLDAVVSDRLFGRMDDIFRTTGFRVVMLKYGTRLEAAFRRPGGDALRRWIDDCPNSRYSALTFKGGPAWRRELEHDLGAVDGIKSLLDGLGDDALHALMTNLAGHDMASVLKAFRAIDDDRPTCVIAYTIKGHGLPLAGHKDNHAGLMSREQMAGFQAAMRVPEGEEWEPFAGLDLPAEELDTFLRAVPFAQVSARVHESAPVPVPERLVVSTAPTMSTQEGFGRILSDLARTDSPLAHRVVTTSPDVTVSTNLGGWVNRRGIFDRREQRDVFRDLDVLSTQRWSMSPQGQHFELGIAENNLFLMLAALGLAGPLFGVRLLPVGTLYDPFIQRGLDALNYACYQDARFLLVATPSGVTLAPEGGAHQSVATPMIGMGMDRLVAFEPAWVDELAEIMRWSFEHMQAPDGSSVYLRLSTRPVTQPDRAMGEDLRRDLLAGGYWITPPSGTAELAIVCAGPLAPEAQEAHAQILEDSPGAGLLAVTSADRLHAGWTAAQRARAHGEARAAAHVERLLGALAPDAALVTVIDGHPASLSWLGAVAGHRAYPLGVDHFGQSGDIPDLYRVHRLDVDAILEAAATACIERRGRVATRAAYAAAVTASPHRTPGELMRIRHLRSALAAALVGAVLAAAAPSARAAEGTMTWGVHVSLTPAFFDPADATGTALPLMVYYGVHDALVRPLPGTPMGNALAQSWSMSVDGLVYEFVLRRGVKFHNGDVVTAEDVKFSFERYRGASAALLKQKVAAVEIPDPSRVRFRLKEPWPDFMTFYATPATGAAWIVPKKYVEKVGDEGFKKQPVGAGPYRFVSFKPGVELVLEAHDGYWRKPPVIKTLVFKVIPDDATRLAALKRGEVDIAYGLSGPLAEEVRRTAGFRLKSATIPVALYLVFTEQDNPKSPWHDRRVRLAANLAIDRQGINQASYLGLGRISSSFIPQALEYYWKPPLYPHDPARARQLLAEAGYPNGFDAGELTSEPFAGAGIGEPVVNDLGAVGIRLKLRLLERAAFLKQHSEKTLKHVVLAGSGAPGNAATRLEQYAVTGGLYAYGGYPEVDGLFKAQAVELNPRARRQILEKMQQIIHERVMFAPILEYAYFVSLGPRVEYDAVNAIPANPYTAPYEDLRLAKR